MLSAAELLALIRNRPAGLSVAEILDLPPAPIRRHVCGGEVFWLWSEGTPDACWRCAICIPRPRKQPVRVTLVKRVVQQRRAA